MERTLMDARFVVMAVFVALLAAGFVLHVAVRLLLRLASSVRLARA